MGGSMKAKRQAGREETEALKAEAATMATVSDPQSGGVSMATDDTPSVAEVKAARKAAVEQQFAEADAKGSPEELEAIRIGQQVRGY